MDKPFGLLAQKAVLLLAALSLMLLASPALGRGAVGPELQAALLAGNPDAELPVIITLAEQAGLHDLKHLPRRARRHHLLARLRTAADRSQGALLAVLHKERAKRIKRFWLGNRLAATLRADAVRGLARLPAVQSVRLDKAFRLAGGMTAAPTDTAEWNIEVIGARSVWDRGYQGAGIVVASLDSGVDPTHQDLAASWRGLDGLGNSWFDPHGEHPAPYDANGHGTQVMGIMAGTNNGGTAIGIAPAARWIAVKLFDDAGWTSYSAVHASFQWLLDPDSNPATDDAPDVVNNSWVLQDTAGQCVEEFAPDIQALKLAGIAVVFAAGNDGPAPATSSSPANLPKGFAVGASDIFSSVADFSSRGPSACDGGLYPAVVAPGVSIFTADLTGGFLPDSYTTVSGTSFAAPHVSGAMALLLDAAPWLTPAALEEALAWTAVSLGADQENDDYGNGRIDAQAALDLVQSICEGDLDNDGDVDVMDVAGLRRDFGRRTCTEAQPCPSDLDRDGDVDVADVAIFRTDFGRRDCPGFQF